MVDLSIIIVSWNAKEYLERCIESIISGTIHHTYEIIVVDNASHDHSSEMVQEKFPQVRLIQLDNNYGFAKANNIGIRQAQGRYISLVNSDILIFPETFDQLIRYMDQHQEVGLCGPRVLNPDHTLQESVRPFPTLMYRLVTVFPLVRLVPSLRKYQHLQTLSEPTEVQVLSGCFMMVRRSAMQEVGYLDERYFMYAEDIDYSKRFHDAQWRVIYHPLVRVIHYGGASSDNAPIRFYIEMRRANLMYWRKHNGYLVAWVHQMLTVIHELIRIVSRSSIHLFIRDKSGNGYKILRSLYCINWIFSNQMPSHIERYPKHEQLPSSPKI
ncbi:MAG: glycosyltransferase family 2 protein [bacterium]|jgi:GT2 family glycosyltransferase